MVNRPQVYRTLSKNKEGTGIGLSLVKSIVVLRLLQFLRYYHILRILNKVPKWKHFLKCVSPLDTHLMVIS
ncbi:MAG: hypothetical protein ACJAX4_004859 [Clostridium sp.]|jgi:hypothetical protein